MLNKNNNKKSWDTIKTTKYLGIADSKGRGSSQRHRKYCQQNQRTKLP